MKVLLTNDDGIQATGLNELAARPRARPAASSSR